MQRKQSIALFVPWLKSKGGVERAILRIMNDKKYAIDLYTLYYDKDRTFDAFQKFRVKQLGKVGTGHFISRGLRLFIAMLSTKIDRLEDYDVFMISTGGVAELMTLRNRHKNTVALVHTPLRVAHAMYDYYRKSSLKYRVILPPLVFVYRLLEKAAWKRINYAIVFGAEVKRRLTDYGLIDADRIFEIGPHADYGGIRKSTRHDKVIFYSSRFVPYKRQDLAITSFKMSKLPHMGFKLVLGGFIEDRKYFEKLKAMVGDDENIVFKPNMRETDMRKEYRDCYATIFLAINEDTGLVPLEALAYGKPVISVNEGGPTEFVKDGYNGLLVDADPHNVASVLDQITDNHLYEKLRRGAIHSPHYTEKRLLRNFDEGVSRSFSYASKT